MLRSMIVGAAAAMVLQSTAYAYGAAPEGHFLRAAQAAAAKQGAVAKNTDTPCTGSVISCGDTVHGTLGNECTIFGSSFAADFWGFSGTAGQHVTITMSASNFHPLVDLQEPQGDSGDGASGAGSGSTPAVVDFTLDNTGSWTIAAGNQADGLGDYTMTLACSGTAGSCTPDDTTLCLGNGRFKVQASYTTTSSGSGAAHQVKLTDDTGYFWFFDQSNVEMVVKVLDGCALTNHFWVYAGGLTDQGVTFTVTDTAKNPPVSKTYTNHLGTKWVTITDVNALASCP